MNASLVLGGLALGAAAAPHCALMCSAPCAAVTRGRAHDNAWLQAGRLVGYATGGAAAASAVSLMGTWSRSMPWLAPFWTLMQLAFLALGLWWLATGRMPARLLSDGSTAIRIGARAGRPWHSTAAGLAWVAWPCGVLQGALLLAALADSAFAGAAVMAAFAVASAPGLLAAPSVWSLWRRVAGGVTGDVQALGYRVAGAALALTAGLALAHTVHARIVELCGG